MKLSDCHNVSDLRKLAKRNLPSRKLLISQRNGNASNAHSKYLESRMFLMALFITLAETVAY